MGIRITQKEKFLWETFARTQKKPVGQVISEAIEFYLNPYRIYRHDDTITAFVHSIENQLEKGESGIDGNELTAFTFRVDSQELEKWNEFISKNFYTRSTFIRQAMQAYFSPIVQFQIKSLQLAPQLGFIKDLLYNTITRLGQTPYEEILKIFSGIDKNLIIPLLDQLVEEARLFRTKHDEYISYEKHVALDY